MFKKLILTFTLLFFLLGCVAASDDVNVTDSEVLEATSEEPVTLENKEDSYVDVNSMTVEDGTVITVTAKVTDEFGDRIDDGSVTFKINKKTYTRNVHNGKAVLEINAPKANYLMGKYQKKGKIITEHNYYKSTYKCSVKYNGCDDYKSSKSTFKITSKFDNYRQYKFLKYKTITMKVKKGIHIKKVGKYRFATVMQKKGSKTKVAVLAGIKNKFLMEYHSNMYAKSNRYKFWEGWIHSKGGDKFHEYTFKKGASPIKVKIKYYTMKKIVGQ